jgi:hypothetical protein
MKQRFARAVCGIVVTRPATTYDNFARDFGERFVPGYQRPSTVDFVLIPPLAISVKRWFRQKATTKPAANISPETRE